MCVIPANRNTDRCPRDRTVKRPYFCTVGLLPVLSGEDVPGHDEPGPRPRHLGHLRAGEGLQGTESRDYDI